MKTFLFRRLCMFLCSVIAMGLFAAPNDPARVEVGLVQVAEYNPPIGANEFGDPGGTAFSAGNLIPDSGFEPISMRKRLRVARTGVESGRVWFEVDGNGGMSRWELTGMGLMNGAAVRIYRIVDSNGQPLPQNASDNYLDLTGAAAYRRVGTSTVPEAGTPGLPFGGWVDTMYAQPSSLYGTRANLDFTDAFWVENGHTYHYIVTAIGSNTNEAGGENESDPATAVEVSAAPDVGLSGAPRVYSSSGSGLNEIGRAVQGSWFSFQARVTGAEGSVSWQLLDENNQVIAPPAGLSFDSTTGTLSGEPTSTPSPTLLRFRATASNGIGSRDFVLNQPDWVPTGGSERPQPPLNVSAVAGDGHVHLSWNASPTPGVVGYRIYRSEAPRSQQRQRIYLAEGAPALVKDDYVHFEKRVLKADPMWAHPRVRQGTVNETWRVDTAAGVSVERVPHPGTIPPEFVFPGESCARFDATQAGAAGAEGPYIFYPANDVGEADWYSQLEPGRTYRYEAWMRQEGLGNGGQVRLGFNQYYYALGQEFVVDGEWHLYGFEFVASERPTAGFHACPRIEFSGPGQLWIDNIRLFRADTPEVIASVIAPPSPLVFNELMAHQPETGEKGMLRSMGVVLNQGTMAGCLSLHRDSTLTMNWYQAVESAPNMTVPVFLQYAYLTGNAPNNRMKPWLNISSHMSEAEWLVLMEYLAAPIDPGNPADVAAKPWAYLRYRQRGTTRPWTDDFLRIYVEFANETWHNGAVSDEWFGWGRSGWVHGGSKEFGLAAHHIIECLAQESPWYTSMASSGKLRIVMGSNYQNYAEIAAQDAPGAHAIGHTTYVGPKWEVGETPHENYDDHGIQATLLGNVADTEGALVMYARSRETLARSGHFMDLLGYEGGPSGYSLPGQEPHPNAFEYSERYGKSLAMATASLEAWLSAYKYGFGDQGYLSMGIGAYWSSHTMIHKGYRPHAGWLATVMRNRYATGRMIASEVASAPTINWDGVEYPLISSYAFRDGNRLSVFVMSRKLGGVHDGVDWGDGSTPVTLVLPGNPVSPATLYRLSGDPRATNRESMQVSIQSSTVNLSRETQIVMPEGSIYLYVVDTDLPDRDDPLPPPVGAPIVSYASNGTTLQWQSVSGASGYTVFRSKVPMFTRGDAYERVETGSTTFTDTSAVGGSTWYYRVAANNPWGTGFWTAVAVGGTNPSEPIMDAPELRGLMEGPGSLVVQWDEVVGASGYRVGLATSAGGPYEWFEAGIATSWLLDNLEDGRTYYVTVYGYSDQGQGPEAVERSGIPLAGGSEAVLAAWEGHDLVYAGHSSAWPAVLPVERHFQSIQPEYLEKGAGVILDPDNYGFNPGTGPNGVGCHYDGKYVFMPSDDGGNFGAAGGGSFANALSRDLFVGFSVMPAAGQSLSISGIDTGFQYSFGGEGRTLLLHLRYRLGDGEWHDLPVSGYQILPGSRTTNDVSIPLSQESDLQDISVPVEFRFYLYSTQEDARYHPVSMYRSEGAELMLRGSVETVGVPGVPSGLRGVIQNGQIMLAWNPLAGVNRYRVRWGSSALSLINLVDDLSQASLVMSDPAIPAFFYTVEGVNSFGAGVASEVCRVGLIPNRAPVLIGIGAKSVAPGQTITFQIAATDENGDVLQYAAEVPPTPDR